MCHCSCPFGCHSGNQPSIIDYGAAPCQADMVQYFRVRATPARSAELRAAARVQCFGNFERAFLMAAFISARSLASLALAVLNVSSAALSKARMSLAISF